MFEIGNSLREARVRRRIDFAQAELATKIRGKYLRALEDEQFDLLPAETYVKGFLRTYAEYLGLDGQLYVDEFNSRFVSSEEHEPRVRRSAARTPQRRHRRIETNVVLIALALIAIPTLLLLTGLRGSTHVAARVTNAHGNVAYDGTITKGDDPVAIRGHRLWVQIDSPENLRVEVRGKLVHVPGQKPRVIFITPTGWRPA